MTLLGIDYGIKNLGLALATGPLAEPLSNLKNTQNVYEQIRQICLKLEVELVVVGISEGKMASQTERFVQKLQAKLRTPIVFQDETLTTRQVMRNLSELKAKRKKRRGPKHAFAASLILQNFLDEQKGTKILAD